MPIPPFTIDLDEEDEERGERKGEGSGVGSRNEGGDGRKEGEGREEKLIQGKVERK